MRIKKGEFNTMQAVYEYPPKLSRSERMVKAAHDLEEHKKMQRNMYKNLALGAVIIAIGIVFVKVTAVKILLVLLGLCNCSVGGLMYWYYALSRDAEVYTRIYDDHIEHSQRQGLSKSYLHICLYYDEVERSYQTNKGRLVCVLKSVERSSFKLMDKAGVEKVFVPKEGSIALSFQDTKGKLVLINDFYEQIGYPHKEYNKIEDDDDYYSEEDMKWDKLHKHGL
ncbi:hypothetical protein [Ruminococcus sp.]|uniref:hypothetical protein n=1 Tax=Ruminococcus sp. TaxID=41978 RepID=UPI0025EC9788|nr:hypothetical protein [Ruminococcus sp.]